VEVSKSKSSDRSSLWIYKKTTATTYACKAHIGVRITKLGGQKKSDERQDSGKTECKEIFSKRILMIHDEGKKITVRYRRMLNLMNSGFVLTALIRNPDEVNKELSGDL
jgi:hypothetical protein